MFSLGVSSSKMREEEEKKRGCNTGRGMRITEKKKENLYKERESKFK
jgi:hypothetical protein